MSAPRPRSVKASLIACVAALALVASNPTPAFAGAGRGWFVSKGTKCLAFQNAYGWHVAASPTFWVGTHAHAGNNVNAVTLSTRLIPTTEGIYWNRNWKSFTLNTRSLDGYNRMWMRVPTYFEDADYDWNLQVKIQWRRIGRIDWKVKFKSRFNEGFCQTGGGF